MSLKFLKRFVGDIGNLVSVQFLHFLFSRDSLIVVILADSCANEINGEAYVQMLLGCAE